MKDRKSNRMVLELNFWGLSFDHSRLTPIFTDFVLSVMFLLWDMDACTNIQKTFAKQ